MGEAERALLLNAFDSNWIAPLGPHVDLFEKELAAVVGLPHCAALSSGTAALHLALKMLQVDRGDDVFVSSFTFSATANAITYLGARPVFIDSDRRTWNMDPALLEDALIAASKGGRLPRAVVVVDLYGQCADYEPILAVCERYGVPVIEDAAEALGATYRGSNAGTFGLISVCSFNGNKIITTSGGGALLSHEAGYVEKARFLATQARDAAPHYQHSEIGYNYRLSNLLAAVGRGQLQVLQQRVDARRRNFEAYQQAFDGTEGIEFMPEPDGFQSTRWLTCITIEPGAFGADRETVRLVLEAENIEARPTWKPMHLQPVFAGCPSFGGSVSEDLFGRGLCLPSGSALTAEELGRVVEIVNSCRR